MIYSFLGRIDKVINPAVAIILEASAFILVAHHIGEKKFNVFSVALVAFTYRFLYLSYVRLLPADLMLASQAADITKFVRFMFTDNLGSLVVINSFMFLSSKVKGFNFDKIKLRIPIPVAASFSLILAICTTVFIR